MILIFELKMDIVNNLTNGYIPEREWFKKIHIGTYLIPTIKQEDSFYNSCL